MEAIDASQPGFPERRAFFQVNWTIEDIAASGSRVIVNPCDELMILDYSGTPGANAADRRWLGLR